MVYLGNRSFLDKDDSLRSDFGKFPNKKKDHCSPPKMKTMKYIDAANVEYSTAKSKQERKKLFQETGCKGTYALRKLQSHDRLWSTPIDPMHLIKNIVSHCVNLIAGHEDSCKVRQEEKFRTRFPTSWVKDCSQNKLPPAPFSLSKDEVTLADERAKRVLVPTGFDWSPRTIFSRSTGMKSHEWKQLASNGILKFCLRGMLGNNQRKTLFFITGYDWKVMC